MQRSEVTRDDGTWTGLSLHVQARRRPDLCVSSAGPRLLVSRSSHPVPPDGAAAAGPRLVRLLHRLDTAKQPTWAWPLPGGEGEWRRLAREADAGEGLLGT
ncbi:hypothetical protein ACFC51_27625 [Streptomyces sp. NPDC055962]|uniref:hypothetical protein n=1 Tax=Streptomyces sp. NPDC055962 TaxID=3345667 RepID=UPI0035D5947E